MKMHYFTKKIVDGGYQATIIRVPSASIKDMGFKKCSEPYQTVKAFYDSQEEKPDIVINGGLFNMKNGKNIMSMIDKGGTLYVEGDKKDTGDTPGYRGIGVTAHTHNKLAYGFANESDWDSFMSCFPMLIMNGVAVPEEEYYNAKSLNYNTSRQVLGFNAKGDVIIITVDKINASGGIKFKALVDLLLENDVQYAINLDGGGSTFTLVDGKTYNAPTEIRKVDNVFYIALKDVATFVPVKYRVKVKTSLNVRYSPLSDGLIIGKLSNEDIVNVTAITNGFGCIGENQWVSMNYLELCDGCADFDELYIDMCNISDSAKEAVKTCVEQGLFEKGGFFFPKDYITREDVAVILAKLLSRE